MANKIFHFTVPCSLVGKYQHFRETNCLNLLHYSEAHNTGLLQMIVGVLTTCHTQYTWDSSM